MKGAEQRADKDDGGKKVKKSLVNTKIKSKYDIFSISILVCPASVLMLAWDPSVLVLVKDPNVYWL